MYIEDENVIRIASRTSMSSILGIYRLFKFKMLKKSKMLEVTCQIEKKIEDRRLQFHLPNAQSSERKWHSH